MKARSLINYCLYSLILLAAAAAGTSTYGQAYLNFSGGGGTDITLTLTQPVVYSVTTAGSPCNFDFEGVGNIFSHDGGDPYFVTGSISYSVANASGSNTYTLAFADSGLTENAVAPNDLYFVSNSDTTSVSVGDIVTLSAGNLTFEGDTATAPASGSYNTFLFGSGGNQLDAVNGVSVAPEPSTWALLGVGAVGAGLVTLRRRHLQA